MFLSPGTSNSNLNRGLDHSYTPLEVFLAQIDAVTITFYYRNRVSKIERLDTNGLLAHSLLKLLNFSLSAKYVCMRQCECIVNKY